MGSRFMEAIAEMTRTNELIELEEKYGAHNYHPLDVVIDRANGVWVFDIEGNRYMDCLASYSAVNQGHCHPEVLKALVEQAHKVTLTSRAFRNDQLPHLYKELHELTGYEMALPMNSGAEAVETAIKAARKWGYKVKGIPDGKAEIIACASNFHGRTVTIVSFSTDEQYRDGFLRDAADLCRRSRVLFITDEIQSGLGRTGKLFAHMHEGVHPDMVIIGKAL